MALKEKYKHVTVIIHIYKKSSESIGCRTQLQFKLRIG